MVKFTLLRELNELSRFYNAEENDTVEPISLLDILVPLYTLDPPTHVFLWIISLDYTFSVEMHSQTAKA